MAWIATCEACKPRPSSRHHASRPPQVQSPSAFSYNLTIVFGVLLNQEHDGEASQTLLCVFRASEISLFLAGSLRSLAIEVPLKHI